MKKGVVSVWSMLTGVTAGTVIGAVGIGKRMGKRIDEKSEMSDKHLALMLLLNQWLITKQEGKSIVDFFHRESIKSIAIYGMSYVGERLYDELKDTDIEVKYAIDKNADVIYADIDIVTPDDELELVDAIIVTPVFYFESISEMLEQKTKIPILSLEDILYEVG